MTDDTSTPTGKPGTFRSVDKLVQLTRKRAEAHDLAKERHTYGRWEEDANDAALVAESVYTSTGTKLLHHPERLAQINAGEYRPIVLQIAPTDKCNLECHFCSTSHREGDELKIDRLMRTIDDMMDPAVGPLKSAEVTGGGDPTMYKPLPQLLGHLRQHGIDIGMITNGILLGKLANDHPGMLDQLTWLRISHSYLDDDNHYSGQNKISNFVIPKIAGDISFSYVWHDKSTLQRLEQLAAISEENKGTFLRIVPDCHDPLAQQKFKEEIAPRIDEMLPGASFGQKKPYDIHNKCRVGFIKPFLNPDGFFYHCSAAPLYEGKFNAQGGAWRIGSMDEAKSIWPHGWKERRMDTSHCHAGMCFYSDQNRMLDSAERVVPHSNFV